MVDDQMQRQLQVDFFWVPAGLGHRIAQRRQILQHRNAA